MRIYLRSTRVKKSFWLITSHLLLQSKNEYAKKNDKQSACGDATVACCATPCIISDFICGSTLIIINKLISKHNNYKNFNEVWAYLFWGFRHDM